VLASLQQVHREQALAQAQEIGLLDPAGPGSYTHPDLSRMVYADGKVVTPLFLAKAEDFRVDTETGEVVPRRHDPDASLHVEGDGNAAWGNKFVIVSTRSEEHRVILDVAYVPERGSGGEAGVAMSSFDRLAPLALGALGVVYDGALRGAHINALMQQHGWLTINRVNAKENRRKRRGQRAGPWVEKERQIETKTLTRATGEQELVPIYARGGAAGISRLNDTGDPVFVPLERVRTQPHANKSGVYRFYNQYRPPAGYVGDEVSVRLDTSEEDTRRGLNRAENLRAIPPADPDFKRLYARRNDAESINRALEDTLYLGRAHSLGQLSQQVDLLGFALMVNSLSLARHRAREHVTVAA
jgi:hypothetical protein